MKPLHWLPGYTKNADLEQNRQPQSCKTNQQAVQVRIWAREVPPSLDKTTCLTPLEIHHSKRSLLAPLEVQMMDAYKQDCYPSSLYLQPEQVTRSTQNKPIGYILGIQSLSGQWFLAPLLLKYI